jgi:hypothetical protein
MRYIVDATLSWSRSWQAATPRATLMLRICVDLPRVVTHPLCCQLQQRFRKCHMTAYRAFSPPGSSGVKVGLIQVMIVCSCFVVVVAAGQSRSFNAPCIPLAKMDEFMVWMKTLREACPLASNMFLSVVT